MLRRVCVWVNVWWLIIWHLSRSVAWSTRCSNIRGRLKVNVNNVWMIQSAQYKKEQTQSASFWNRTVLNGHFVPLAGSEKRQSILPPQTAHTHITHAVVKDSRRAFYIHQVNETNMEQWSILFNQIVIFIYFKTKCNLIPLSLCVCAFHPSSEE